MRIKEAKQCIKELYKTGEVTALISERGVGKTSAYQQCAEELGIGYMALYAAALEGPDFMGLPDRSSEAGITRYLAPQFMPTEAAIAAGLFPEKGLLVFEEINRVPSDTVSVLYPLLLEGRINNHQLAPGWKIGVTMNPDTLNYAVNALDDALIDRFVSIEVTPNLEDYVDYSLMTGHHEQVLSYLGANPDMLLIVRESAESDPLAKSPTPRGWTKVQNILNSCDLEEHLAEHLVAGIVGPLTAASFFGYLRTNNLAVPAAQDCLEDYPAQQPLFVELMKEDRFDIINMVLKRMIPLVTIDGVHLENLNALLKFLPEEFTIMFFKYLATLRGDDFDEITAGLPVFEDASESLISFITE